jgi:hypothetical protein
LKPSENQCSYDFDFTKIALITQQYREILAIWDTVSPT